MKKNNNIWCVFLSENGLSFTIGSHQSDKEQKIGFVPFEPGIIEKGYIKDPKFLQQKLQEIKKQYSISSKSVRIVLGEENLLLKKININKSLVQDQKLGDYINSQLGLTIHFPYDFPILDFYVIDETDEAFDVLIFLSDSNLIQDYVDLFDSIHMRNIEFDNAFMANYRLYYHYLNVNETKDSLHLESSDKADEYIPNQTGLMFVSIYHNILSISIFDKMVPSFTLTEELETGDFCDSVANYIERVANYYQYNINKGKQEIKYVEVFDYRDCSKNLDAKHELRKKITDIEIGYFDFSIIEAFSDELCHKGFFMAFAASIKK
ncbi:MAG: pilus assembly protein PilM [Candidatus Izemoplasmatales bacterium]|jgi:type IV pilus assembly protein PilM|nr:pilus assembly protein PilM [Candidatus Izemoplasmatales bacterium]